MNKATIKLAFVYNELSFLHNIIEFLYAYVDWFKSWLEIAEWIAKWVDRDDVVPYMATFP